MADWANLPFELLESIALHLASVDDFTVFSAVCKSWHSVWSELKEKILLPPRLPWLILAEDQDNQQIRPIFSLSNSKTYEIKLPEASRTNCVAANYGWIFTLSPDLQINLLHPFSRIQIPLPSMLGFSDQYNYDEEFKPEGVAHMFVTKAVLSRNPRDDEKGEWVIVAIYGQFRILGFAREGDKVWTDIPCPSRCYEDVVFYKGKFYAVDCHGIVIVCEIDDPKSTVIAPAPVGTRDTIQKYLVESSGDLLLISRERGGFLFEGENVDEILPRYYTKRFSVLKLEKNNNAGEKEDEAKYEYPFCWIEVKSLGDRALFLGRNPSVSLSASEFEGLFKPNCIYFTDDNEENFYFEPGGGGGVDMGIFNMENSTIEPHFTGESRSPISPPFWYL